MKFIVWVNYGYEGWQPYEFDSLEAALKHESYGSEKKITKEVKYNLVETE